MVGAAKLDCNACNALFACNAGWGYRSESQVAGLGIDTNLLRFVRQHFMAKVALPVSRSSTVTLTAEAGLLLPWGAQSTTSISDRFFLGGLGVGALRGFAQKGVGPSDQRRKPSEVGVTGLGNSLSC